MNYYSTNRQAAPADFREATIRGQALDRGLYFPERIPAVDPGLISDIENLPVDELGTRIMLPYVGNTISETDLNRIVRETLAFPIPLKQLADDSFVLELFHGPTLAFKDVGARFMSRCLGHFMRDEKRKVTVLVATSGDTGGAVADGFHNVEGVEVVILYPSGKVSPVQEKQLTTHGNNIRALEIEGSFDDCQQMVKEAFADQSLQSEIFLTSANSINVARWLPQQLYYFLAWRQWQDRDKPPVISVPSGNFGNLCAGILAWKSGLPVRHFIAACNENDIVSAYLASGVLTPKQAVPTISNAMDVGNPSNFVRILELFNNKRDDLAAMMSADMITDDETRKAMASLFNRCGYIADPHGAVAWLALQHYLEKNPGEKGIFLETAHPVKFPESVQQVTGREIDVPAALGSLMRRPKLAVKMLPDYNLLKDFLLS